MPVIHQTQEAHVGLEHYIGSKPLGYFFKQLKLKQENFYCMLKKSAVNFIAENKENLTKKIQVPFPLFFQHYLPTFNSLILPTNNHFDKVSQEVAENCAFHCIKKKSGKIFIGPFSPSFPIVIPFFESLRPFDQTVTRGIYFSKKKKKKD